MTKNFGQQSKKIFEEKKEAMWLSPMTKAPSYTEKSKKQRDNIKTPPKTLITQRLRTDLGRSVGVTAVTPLVNVYCNLIYMKRFNFAWIFKKNVWFLWGFDIIA